MKKKEPKAKHNASPATDSSSRGRGRGSLDGRGRGRGAERGARTGRGQRSTSQANGTKHTEKSTKPADDGWTESATNGDAAAEDWPNEPGKNKLESLETEQAKPASAAAPSSGKGAWASLFAKPPPASTATPKAEPPPAPEPAQEKAVAPEPPVDAPQDTAPSTATEAPDEEQAISVPPPIEPITVEDGPSELPSAPHSDVASNDLVPAGDELTKENVNKLPDVSHPITSVTVASTAASTQDPLNPALPSVQAIRPGISGHAASALRATTGGSGRTASHSRKVMEQQEPVVMPGNHAVDRAAVQFGKMGLDADDIDADEEREEPETRTQLPDDSPTAPRASLPPAAAEPQPTTQAAPIETPAEPPVQQQPSQPPGLPAASQPVQDPSPSQPNALPDQYRYGSGPKPYDPFSQQPPSQGGPNEPFSNQLPGQSQGLPNTSQQEAYQQYYGRDYGQYYGYGQGQGHGQNQESQRSGGAFGTSAQDAPGQHASAGPRGYGSQDIASGNNTPNPHIPSHQNQPSGHMQQGPNAHGGYPYGQYGGNYGSGYPYGTYGSMGHGGHGNHQGGRYGANRPMFDDVRRQQDDYYSNQYQYSHNQGYSSSYGKSGMYGGPQQHQYSHDYSSSPGNAAFAGRDGYGRAGSTQPNDGQQTSTTNANAYGGSMPDPFGRTSSGFGQSQHGAHSGGDDPAKPTGPSPSLQGNRPGSAAQPMAGQQQSGVPQGGQQGFAGYPQYGGFGNQSAQHSSYGGYGTNNAFAGYGAGYGGRGWSGQYSSQH